ncbi:NINE protein [Allosphingosinicella sp.]|uniref:NINE protein n=1 Tax=Allosphingosinicella sp. TaxID=2823234 RepID=UPI003784B467
MNARTFGKKGSPAGGDAAPVSRRAAFLAQERARADGESRAADTDVFPGRGLRATTIADRIEFVDAPEKQREPVGPRSLGLTWTLWFLTGLAGVHRLYLGRYITGALQAALFIGCVTLVFGFQRYPAFLGVAISWLWMLLDGLSLKKMYAEAVGTPTGAEVIEV